MKLSIFCFLVFNAITSGWAQENARIIEHSTIYTIYDEGKVQLDDYRRISIKNEKGLRLSVYYDYIDSFRKITEVSVDVFDATGKRVKRLKKVDGHTLAFNQAFEITDARLFVLDPDYQNYPFTVEISSRIELQGFLSLPTWLPGGYFSTYVESAQLTVKRPDQVKIAFRAERIEGQSFSAKGWTETNYAIKDLPTVDEKTSFRELQDQRPRVLVTPMSFFVERIPGSNASWKDFGNWYYQLNQEPEELSEETTRFVESLEGMDQRVVIEKLFRYMQKRTRYVSIQFGIGGFKSLPLEKIERYSYGDCKALSKFMKEMLNHAGIKSNYVLARAGREAQDVIADFPSNQFNHVFLAVPLGPDTVLLECTSKTSPPHFIGTFTDDRNVLWIEKDASQLIRTPVSNWHENKLRHNISIKVSPEGECDALIKTTSDGIFFEELMLFQSAPDDFIDSHIRKKFRFADFSVRSYSYEFPDSSVASFNASYLLNVNGFAQQITDKMLLPSMPGTGFSKFFLFDDLRKEARIDRAFSISDTITIQLPGTFRPGVLPESTDFSNQYGRYHLVYQVEANKVKIVRQIQLSKGYYKKERFAEFKAFTQQIDRIEGRKLVIYSKT